MLADGCWGVEAGPVTRLTPATADGLGVASPLMMRVSRAAPHLTLLFLLFCKVSSLFPGSLEFQKFQYQNFYFPMLRLFFSFSVQRKIEGLRYLTYDQNVPILYQFLDEEMTKLRKLAKLNTALNVSKP
jgi:hypothetical protein